MSAIAQALKKDRRAYFLIELDFSGWKYRISTSDQQVENADGDPLLFHGLIKNRFSVGSTFDFRSFRYSAPNIRIDMINTDRFQDNQSRHRLDAGFATIWLWSPSLDWTDIADHPIFRGGIQKIGGSFRDTYSFNITDFSLDRGKIVTSFSMSSYHPADIIRAIFSNKTCLDLDHIDLGSLETLRHALPGWQFSSTVDAEADAFDVVDRVIRQCWCARWQRQGRIGVAVFDRDAPALNDLRDTDFIGESGETFDNTPRDAICNDLSARYGYSGGAFGSTLTQNYANNNLCSQSRADYGPRPQVTLSLADVPSLYQAAASTSRYLNLFAFPHDLFRCQVPYWLGFDLYEGDVALISHRDGPSADGAGWQQERCLLFDRKFEDTGIHQTWWRIDI